MTATVTGPLLIVDRRTDLMVQIHRGMDKLNAPVVLLSCVNKTF